MIRSHGAAILLAGTLAGCSPDPDCETTATCPPDDLVITLRDAGSDSHTDARQGSVGQPDAFQGADPGVDGPQNVDAAPDASRGSGAWMDASRQDLNVSPDANAVGDAAAPDGSLAGDAAPSPECTMGAERSCKDDPGLLAQGNCAKGKETCTNAGHWGPCSIQPATKDQCTAGDDANCNGTVNENCPCIDGQTLDCGPSVEVGICKRGKQTCTNAAWSMCVGAVSAKARDCTSNLDNDCDGKPDSTIDTVCQCAPQTTRVCNAHPGFDGKGPCKAGSQSCTTPTNRSSSAWGACSGAVGPAASDACTAGSDNNCNSVPNEGCCGNGVKEGTEECDKGSANKASAYGKGLCTDKCKNAPYCGDGVRNGAEACDNGGLDTNSLGSCDPECAGFYEKRRIWATYDNYSTNLGGPDGADAKCQAEIGAGYKALLVGGSRRATVTPFKGDGQTNWVIQKYRHYYNQQDSLIWITDDLRLLGVRNGQRVNLYANAFSGGGSYPWSGYAADWTTIADDSSKYQGTCQGWTSATPTQYGNFIGPDLQLSASELCGTQAFILCVEQ